VTLYRCTVAGCSRSYKTPALLESHVNFLHDTSHNTRLTKFSVILVLLMEFSISLVLCDRSRVVYVGNLHGIFNCVVACQTIKSNHNGLVAPHCPIIPPSALVAGVGLAKGEMTSVINMVVRTSQVVGPLYSVSSYGDGGAGQYGSQ
jgi:hypothetical protein